MDAILVGLCVFAALMVTLVGIVRYYRNDEHLRWLRIEQRARTREAASRVAARYASLPSVTVVPFPPPLAAHFEALGQSSSEHAV